MAATAMEDPGQGSDLRTFDVFPLPALEQLRRDGRDVCVVHVVRHAEGVCTCVQACVRACVRVPGNGRCNAPLYPWSKTTPWRGGRGSTFKRFTKNVSYNSYCTVPRVADTGA